MNNMEQQETELFLGGSNIQTTAFDNSSTLSECSYDQLHMTLKIKFRTGDSYIFQGVDPDTHLSLIAANSAGKFFHRFIKDKFPFQKLPKQDIQKRTEAEHIDGPLVK